MIIDSCYEAIVAKLTAQGRIKEISLQLRLMDTNDKRVLFVYKIFEDLNAFPKVLDVHKNDNLSSHYRNLGNTCFQEYKHHKAWQYYNLSLLNATLKSENYCLALSNRSAVFYELEKFHECLQDIESILLLEYPKKILEKLMKRKEMCEEVLKTKAVDVELHEKLEIECVKDSRYLAASDKLEVLYTNEMGRHVIAKKDIKVGEVLAQEDPYFSLLLKSQLLCSCSYCLSRSLNLIPCDSCCLALYCSVECKNKAWQEYHSVECPLMVTLMKMDFTKLELLALRTVIRARHDHNNWNDLLKTIEAADANYNTEFRGHVKINDKWIYDSKYYASIHTLATNIDKRSISDIFQKALTAAVFLRFLEQNTMFLNVDSDEDKENIRSVVAGLLLLHIMTSPTNMHGIGTNVQGKNGEYVEEASLASAPYAFFSLLNHSCAPNVVRFNKLGSATMTLFALRPIKKGMQIFDNYGSHHGLEGRVARQESLKFQYKFTCMCEACVNNWPTYFTLASSQFTIAPPNISKAKNKILTLETIRNLKKGDVKTAGQVYKKLCIMGEMLEPYAPCMDLCDVQESIKQCLCIFEGLPNYGGTQLIEWKEMVPEGNIFCKVNNSVKDTFKAMVLH
ncbi:SET and MYND domain-containing protein 4 [Pararge aegeria]|uniref:Protein-lysine N-methyltransferase SMYD4 n=2 Tax=Pararge aegeria TaxID=116150 RepID=A0A8S4RJN8_9NEOP|nr:SET and MYND domain-containing protein 4 [Pararge aegeria]CAH2236054.1 jg7345 [Pararge aegeria aegeria]